MMKVLTPLLATGLAFLVCSCANERVFYKGCVVCTASDPREIRDNGILNIKKFAKWI